MQVKSIHQYYIKAKNQSKDTKPKPKEPLQATASQISLILSKMNTKDNHATSERANHKIQTSPKLQSCLSASNLISKTSQSPKLSLINFAKECPSSDIDGLLEMEERKRILASFKDQLAQNKLKINHLEQLQTQIQLIEQQLHSIVQTIVILKDELCQSLQQEQISYKQTTQSISESLSKMQDDIQHNEINIIEQMQMKPFENIMAIYKKRLDEHQVCLQQMIQKRQYIIQFNQWCQQLMIKLQFDPKFNYLSDNKENTNYINRTTESPKFRDN